MASSESQRIMNLSLTKIMSSRSRRGGVSLHRNLLVASVLFKARDVYAAEMAGLVVIRNGCVYEPSAVSDADPKAETQDISNENLLAADETSDITAADENFSTDESLIRDEQIMETINAIVCPSPVPDSTQEQSGKLDSAGDTSSHNNKSDSELESCKENIEPSNSNQSTSDLIIVGKLVKPKRSRKQATTTKQSLKRKYTEVEQAVLSITESETPKKLSRVVEEADGDCGGKMDLTCNELSSSFPEWHSDRVCANHREENHVTNTTTISQDYKSSCMDISDDAYSSSDSDQSTYSELTTYQPSFHSFSTDYCTSSSSSSDAITFSLSHPMLVSV